MGSRVGRCSGNRQRREERGQQRDSICYRDVGRERLYIRNVVRIADTTRLRFLPERYSHLVAEVQHVVLQNQGLLAPVC